MIRPSLLLAAAWALLVACDRLAPRGAQQPELTTAAAPRTSSGSGAGAAVSPPAKPARRVAADAALASIVLRKESIAVDGQPACALAVRYRGNVEQPVTWRGESCEKVHVDLFSLDDLRRIAQDEELPEESRDDLARLPGGEAVYIEGESSSALYPANVMGRIYTVPLAD